MSDEEAPRNTRGNEPTNDVNTRNNRPAISRSRTYPSLGMELRLSMEQLIAQGRSNTNQVRNNARGGSNANQVENNNERNEDNNNNTNRGHQPADINNATTANDMNISSSPEGRGSTGGQGSQIGQPAGAGGILGTPRRLWNKAVKQVKGRMTTGQGNEGRGEGTTED